MTRQSPDTNFNHRDVTGMHRRVSATVLALAGCCLSGCMSPADYRLQADRSAYQIIQQTQQASLGRTEPLTIETPADALRRRLLHGQGLQSVAPASVSGDDLDAIPQWPDDDYLDKPTGSDPVVEPDKPIHLSLTDALQIAACNSRQYQAEKEQVFLAALDLDLEADGFRNTFQAALDGQVRFQAGQPVVINEDGATEPKTITNAESSALAEMSRQFKSGINIVGLIGLDLAALLTQDRVSSRGVFADASISIPLLRGSGRFVVAEPLTQAQRNMVYAIYEFERFKRVFAVGIGSDYLAVLRQLDQIENERENYRGLISSTRRARRLADAGRLPEIQVDQARQDELRARNRWISTQQGYLRQLDTFKVSLGLPTDAAVELDRADLDRLSSRAQPLLAVAGQDDAQSAEIPSPDAPIELVEPSRESTGLLAMDDAEAIRLAMENRLDFRVELGRVHDAQRSVAVTADQLRADVTLLGSGSIGEGRSLGSADRASSNLRFDKGNYSTGLTIDLPLERTAERNRYRASLIAIERAVRNAQAQEDQIKLEVRNGQRRLLESREAITIQAEAVVVAGRRVKSTQLFLQAGRAQIRDVLEAQESLVSAQNALTAALVSYRVAELELQRDLGLLQVNELGLWREYSLEDHTDGKS